MKFRVRGLSFLPGLQHIVMEQMRLSAENWNPRKNSQKKLLQKQIQWTVRSLDSGRAQLVSSWWEPAIDLCTCELLPPDSECKSICCQVQGRATESSAYSTHDPTAAWALCLHHHHDRALLQLAGQLYSQHCRPQFDPRDPVCPLPVFFSLHMFVVACCYKQLKQLQLQLKKHNQG